MPSRQALELLQVRQIRSPGQELRNSSRHLRHLRSFGSYVRSGSGLEFFSELLMARTYSSSLSQMRYILCTAQPFSSIFASKLDRVNRDRPPLQGTDSFRFERQIKGLTRAAGDPIIAARRAPAGAGLGIKEQRTFS